MASCAPSIPIPPSNALEPFCDRPNLPDHCFAAFQAPLQPPWPATPSSKHCAGDCVRWWILPLPLQLPRL